MLFSSHFNAMKIAIPTDNGLFVAPRFRDARGLLVLEVKLGEIVSQQIYWKPEEPASAKENGWAMALAGCDTVLLSRKDEPERKTLPPGHVRVVETGESIITRAILDFLETNLRKEANNCCCP